MTGADLRGLVSKALHAEFAITVLPVKDTGHLLPDKVERITRYYFNARGFGLADLG
jgi:hypothetical protein